mmetsp:Transcript_30569/g.22662  ORF Transcript_30569/g.22662 Transcript_30569/m.22662 type:complete len:126 (-) Transcript_30569:36-413(-)
MSGTNILDGSEEGDLSELSFSEENSDSGEPMLQEGDQQKPTKESKMVFPITAQAFQFQYLMILVSIYYAMLLSNWGNPTIYTNQTDYFEANELSFWIKIISQWMSIGVFAFSILGPLCISGRQFG